MHLLRVSRVGEVWRVSLRARGNQLLLPEMVLDGLKCGRRILMDWCGQLESQGIWQLELPKASIGEGEIAVGLATLLAERCARHEGVEHESAEFELAGPRQWCSRRSVLLAMKRKGLKVAGTRVQTYLDRSSVVLAAVVAWLGLFTLALRFPRNGAGPIGDRWWLAVHGETSNRTRHLIAALRHADPPAAIVVLGRQRVSLKHIRASWTTHTDVRLPPLVRPWTLYSILKSLPAAWRRTCVLLQLAPHAPFLPTMRERVAILWRVYAGEASAIWWNGVVSAPTTVVYGHTGTADTTILEIAQQASGSKTVHVVHGVSNGLNFIGKSNIAVFRCGHDASWHARLGGYGKCVAEVAAMPRPITGNLGTLLLTNLAHPMHPGYRAFGIREEADVLRFVAGAAEIFQYSKPLRWKRHPVFSSLPISEQSTLLSLAEELGYEVLPIDGDWKRTAIEARWVVATASTVVIDLLELGCTPVMLASDWLEPGCALAQYPLVARGVEGLVAAFDLLEDVGKRAAMRARAWNTILPGRADGWFPAISELA